MHIVGNLVRYRQALRILAEENRGWEKGLKIGISPEFVLP